MTTNKSCEKRRKNYGKDCCAVCGRYCANDNYTKKAHFGVYCTEECLDKAIPKPKEQQ